MYLGGNGFYWRIVSSRKTGVIKYGVRRTARGHGLRNRVSITTSLTVATAAFGVGSGGPQPNRRRRLRRARFRGQQLLWRNDASATACGIHFEGIEDERIGDFGSLGGGAAVRRSIATTSLRLPGTRSSSRTGSAR